ncbi:MAG: RidA family protein [candidate division Zixibacteria bacterium]|nr:RidA family protein [candidate division Zixibacteria bacterium]MDH3939067.1 RidA family protein [candidate division Zixibacteria bacterium]MDH4033600.1 RidA family protein [candidate division Zixibacteria bacterium]
MKEIITTDQAPAAIGPYSQAVKATGRSTIYCSGQIALVPGTSELLDGDVTAQCKLVMTNLQAVLKAAGAAFSDVVKTTIYLQDMADFVAVNEVYASYFDDKPPARATVAVRGLPKGVQVEIDAIAVL